MHRRVEIGYRILNIAMVHPNMRMANLVWCALDFIIPEH